MALLKGYQSTTPNKLFPELQIYKDTIRCGTLGAEVPEVTGPRRTTDANLDCAFVKTTLVFFVK